MEGGFVQISIENSIGSITFGHPDHNALPGTTLRQLTEAFTSLGQRDEVKAILLQSEGARTFCAGAHFSELLAIKTSSQGRDFFMGFANVINAMRTCGKLVIGRIQGKSVGGGVGLIAACDYAMATKYASLRLSELNLGIGPFVIAPAVERKLGKGKFSQLVLNPKEWQTAKWGFENGLFQELFDQIDQLDDYLDRYLDHLSKLGSDALKGTKKLLWEGTDHWTHLLAERAQESGSLVISKSAQQAIKGRVNLS